MILLNLSYFRFRLEIVLKLGFCLCLKIVLIHGISAKMPLSLNIFPPAKIISLRNDIMNFKQLDHEHVAQSWERMKLMIHNCPTHGLNSWMIIQKNYARLKKLYNCPKI